MDVVMQWPPITRFLVVASFSMSIMAHTGFLPVLWLLYIPKAVFTLKTIPQIWRPLSAFLLTGPGFSMFMDPYFIYQYSHSLEKDSPRFSEIGSYFTYVLFNGVVITGLAGHYFGGVAFMPALILALAYTSSQENPEQSVNFFVVTLPGKYLPYALLFLTFVMGGPDAAKLSATGLFSAHLYDFLTRLWPQFGGGRNYITTPPIIKRWFGGDGTTRPAPQQRGYGTSFGAPPARAPATGSWNNQRGPGRRLGD